MIIDSHTHIDRAKSVDMTPEGLLSSMDEAGIDYSIVIANDLTHSSNEQVIAYAQDHKRLLAVACVNIDSFGDEQVDKLIGYLQKKQTIGIKLYPGYQNYYPYENRFFPLFDFCEKNNFPIVIHTGILMTGCEGYLEQAHPLHVDRIAHSFPKLKIIMAHMGNPWLIDTVAVMWKNPNVYTDFSGYFTEFKPIAQYEVDDFLKKMIEVKKMMGSYSRFLFGTDWPLYSQKEYLQAIQSIHMSSDEKTLVFSQNAINVFKLDVKD